MSSARRGRRISALATTAPAPSVYSAAPVHQPSRQTLGPAGETLLAQKGQRNHGTTCGTELQWRGNQWRSLDCPVLAIIDAILVLKATAITIDSDGIILEILS
jgi:hypothetical protein